MRIETSEIINKIARMRAQGKTEEEAYLDCYVEVLAYDNELFNYSVKNSRNIKPKKVRIYLRSSSLDMNYELEKGLYVKEYNKKGTGVLKSKTNVNVEYKPSLNIYSDFRSCVIHYKSSIKTMFTEIKKLEDRATEMLKEADSLL